MPLFVKGMVLFLTIFFIMLRSCKRLQSELLRNVRNLLRNLNIFAIANYYCLIGPSACGSFSMYKPERKKPYCGLKPPAAYMLRPNDTVVASFLYKAVSHYTTLVVLCND